MPKKHRGGTGASLQRSIVVGPVDASEEKGSTGSAGESEGGQPDTATPGAAPASAAGASTADGSEGPPSAAAPTTDEGNGSTDADAGEEAEPITAATLDEHTAKLVAEFAARFGSGLGDVTGPTARLLDPRVRRAAARLVPESAEELGGGQVQRTAAHESGAGNHLQRSPAAVQREGKGTGNLPTRKVKVTIPNWSDTPLFKDVNLGSWFLLSGGVESPTYEGVAKPPDHLRDDTKEEELQLTADGLVSGYAETFHKETLLKVGDVELEGQVAVEVTSKSVKVSAFSLTFPNFGGESGLLLKPQLDFSLLEWEKGKRPGLMVLSATAKLGVTDSNFNEAGWQFTGSLFLPIKVSIQPNPAKVAEFVTRVIGPRLAAAAPAGLAIAAPLAAGGVCLALWINAVKAGEDFATAIDHAKGNTQGFVLNYFDTIMGYPPKYSNQGGRG